MMISEEATDIAQQLHQASVAQTQMNDTSVVQGRDPVTTLARPSVDRQEEGLCPPTDLGDIGFPHQMPEEARGLLSGLGPVVTFFWLSWQASHTEAAVGATSERVIPGQASL